MTTPTITFDIAVTVNGERVAPEKAARFLAALGDDPVGCPKACSTCEALDRSLRLAQDAERLAKDVGSRPPHPFTPLNDRLDAIERGLSNLRLDHDHLHERVCGIQLAVLDFANSAKAAFNSLTGVFTKIAGPKK